MQCHSVRDKLNSPSLNNVEQENYLWIPLDNLPVPQIKCNSYYKCNEHVHKGNIQG